MPKGVAFTMRYKPNGCITTALLYGVSRSEAPLYFMSGMKKNEFCTTDPVPEWCKWFR